MGPVFQSLATLVDHLVMLLKVSHRIYRVVARSSGKNGCGHQKNNSKSDRASKPHQVSVRGYVRADENKGDE